MGGWMNRGGRAFWVWAVVVDPAWHPAQNVMNKVLRDDKVLAGGNHRNCEHEDHKLFCFSHRRSLLAKECVV